MNDEVNLRLAAKPHARERKCGLRQLTRKGGKAL